MSDLLSPSHRHQRWYDQIPALGNAINTMETLPPGNQILIAQVISSSIYNSADTKSSKLKQYGTDKIIGLLKAERKLRWYDKDPILHQAFHDLYLAEIYQFQKTAICIILSVAQLLNHADDATDAEQCREFVTDIFSLDDHSLYKIGLQLGIDIQEHISVA